MNNIIFFFQILISSLCLQNTEVKQNANYPKPDFFALATIDSIFDGTIEKEEFLQQKKLLLISNTKNLEIRGFKMVYGIEGFPDELVSINEYFTDEMNEVFATNLRHAKLLIFTEIICVKNKKDTFYLNNIKIWTNRGKSSEREINRNIVYPAINGVYCGDIQQFKLIKDSIEIQNESIYKEIIYFESCSIVWDGFFESPNSQNKKFTTPMMALICKHKVNSYIILHQIKATTNQNDTILLPPIVFKLIN